MSRPSDRDLRPPAPGASPSPGGVLWWVLRGHWAAGIVLLASLTAVSRPALLAAAAAFLAGTVMDRAQTRRRAWRRIDVPLAAVAVAAAAADLFLGSGDLLSAVSVLVLGVQAIKLLLPKGARDGWQLCAISFLGFLAAAASTSEIRFAAFAVLYLGLSVGAMWALQAEAAADEGFEGPFPVRTAFAVRLLLASSVGGALLTAVLFAVTPRIGLGQILRRAGVSGGLTGFSDTISLKDVTGVKIDRRVVARVEFPVLAKGVRPTELYLRGAGYSLFDGSAWTRTDRHARTVPRSGFYYIVAPPHPGASLSTADITLEPMETPSLFVYGAPTLIEGSLGEIRTDGVGSFSFPAGSRQAVRYRLQFSREAGSRAYGAIPPSPVHLRLPLGWGDLDAMAARIAAPGRTDGERAEILRRYFLAGFRYTVDDPARSIREFLTVKKAGFCEHYATALCLLLRAAGIPARVAAGYMGGEWSDVGKYLIVRQSDAHAWTEAWIDGRWVTLDATPPLGEQSPFFARTGTIGFYLDWMRQRWNKYVIGYSLKMQAEGLSEGWRAARRARAGILKALAGEGRFGGRPGVIALCVLSALAAGAALWRFLGKAPGAAGVRGRPDGERPPPAPYARLLRRLAARGYRRSPGSTIEEMVRGAAAERPFLEDDASRLVDLYHRDRFGPGPLSSAEAREAVRLAGRIGREIARSGAR